MLPVTPSHPPCSQQGNDPWGSRKHPSGAASCCLCSLATGAASMDSAQPGRLAELFGSVQGAMFRNLLFRAAPPRESVQMLQLAEAFCHALRSEPGLGVMVPALGQCLTHCLDALQGKMVHRHLRVSGGSRGQGSFPQPPPGPQHHLSPLQDTNALGPSDHRTWGNRGTRKGPQ